MADLMGRIRERKIVQWLIVYVTGAWAITEVIDTLAVSILSVPSVRPVLLLVAALGVPFVLVLAWYHGEKGRQRVSGPEFVIIVTLLGVLGGVFMLVGDRQPAVAESTDAIEPAPAIAVLPSVSAGSEADEIGEGVVSVLSTGLDAVPGWRAVSARTVYARWAERIPEGSVPDETTALEIARSTGASYAVLPTTTVLGDSVRVTAEVWDLTRDGTRPQSIARSGSPDDLLSLSDGLAIEVLGAVLRGSGQIPEIDLSRTTSESPEALRSFLRGEVFYREFRLEDARDAFDLALDIDPTFARAHYRLIEVHNWGVTWDQNEIATHTQLALENIDRLSEREALVIRGLTAPDLRDRVGLLRDAVSRYPDDATAWNWLGEELMHGLGALASAEEIDSVFRRAIELDPGRAVLYPHPVGLLFAELADSARAANLVPAFATAASGVSGAPIGDIDPRGAPLAFAFAFGDLESRSAAQVRILDEYGAGTAEGLAAAAMLIGHPRNWEDIVLPTLEIDRTRAPNAPRPQRPDPRRRTARFDGFVQWRGSVRDGIAELDSIGPDLARAIHDAALMGIPVPTEVLQAEFGPDRIQPNGGFRLFRATMLAAHEERWSDFDRGLDLLRDAATTDSAGPARTYREIAIAYGALRQGDAEAAVEPLERLTFSGVADSRLVVWLLGEAYMAVGRWIDAERVFRAGGLDSYFRHFSAHPLVRLRLARALDAQGRATEAIEAYAFFAEHWADADAELQPLVQDAREAIERLRRDSA